jgi:hypothetical protein
MSSREQIIDQEARELWRALHDEPPPEINGSALLEMILQSMAMGGYDRLRSRHLRDGQIARPRPPSDR